MTHDETRKFWFVGALLGLLACEDASAPTDGGTLDGGSMVGVDAASASDATIVSDATSARDASSVGDAAQPGRAQDGSVMDAGDDPIIDPPYDAGSPACMVTDASAVCTSKNIVMVGAPSDTRRAYWNLPAEPAPTTGYPVVLLYQGTGFGPAATWNTPIASNFLFGGYYQIALVAELLAHGYAVIQPEASGGSYWTTNLGGNYDTSLDGVFIPQLLSALADGTFGKLDQDRLYATGISSGGYMTSRMAVSYPGRFRALAVESGAYATCAGPFCTIPAQLPADHPPTLLLHGGADTTVPISTARDYETKLKSSGIEVKFVEDPTAGHQWLNTAPTDVRTWFDAH